MIKGSKGHTSNFEANWRNVMSIEDFRNLLDIQSFEMKIYGCLKKIESHRSRISLMVSNRESKTELLATRKLELNEARLMIGTSEKELYRIETQIKKSNENLKIAATEQQMKASENELSVLVPKAASYENEALELMDKSEKIQEEIDLLNGFLEGSVETLDEIKIEVSRDVENEEKEISNFKERIDALISECPNEIKDIFLSVNERFKYKNPLAFIENGSCNQCFLAINRNTQSQVDKCKILELCTGCGRLLAPSGIL